MNELIDNLQKAQGEFFKAAILEVYNTLNIDDLIIENKDEEQMSYILKTDYRALVRFLNAAASLNIVKKNEYGVYEILMDKPAYNVELSLVLFWLMKHKIPDLLSENIPTQQLVKKFGIVVEKNLEKAHNYKLISLFYDNYVNYKVLEPFLLSEGNKYIGKKISHYEHIMYPMFSCKGLLGALQSGKSQWKEIFGIEASTPFDVYKSQPNLLKDFTFGLHNLNTEDNIYFSKYLNEIFHFDRHTFLDVGGGSGAWALALLENSSCHFHIDIYELPQAIPLLSSVFLKYAPQETRINYMAGSFCEKREKNFLCGIPQEKKYDFISLGWILHDWNDETCIQILKKVYNHLKYGGYLFVFETLLSNNKICSDTILDLAMLLQTEGRERTLEEYRDLLNLAGFKDINTLKTPTKRQLISARKF